MDEHPREHEAVLEALLTGERSATEPEAEALLASCATCRARYEELKLLESRIRGAGTEEREIVDEAAKRVGAPGEERVEEVVRGLRGSLRESARGPRWPLFAAAAAVLFLALGAGLWWPRDSGDGSERPDGALGDDVEMLHPVGEVEEYGTFSWSYGDELPPRAYYLVMIYDDTDENRDALVDETRKKLRADEWTPTTPDAGWPSRIRWTVEVMAPGDNQIGFGYAEAQLSSR